MQIDTVKELSKILRKAPQSIYNDLGRNPQSLPPTANIPGSRRVLFVNVYEWLTSHIKNHQPPKHETKSITKRGRPPKSEQVTSAKKKS